MNNYPQPTLTGLIVKTCIVHTLTYTMIGIFAFNVLNYTEAFSSGALASFMRPTSHPLIKAGPMLQPIRGLIFALAFFPLRDSFFGKRNGWLTLWWTLIALGILSTFGPSPASIEGMIYTVIPTRITSYIEIVPQAFLLSAILFYWINNPQKKWLNWTLGLCFAMVMLMSATAYLAASGLISLPQR